MTIHWYPGHMARTRRELAASLKAVDAVVCLADARLPRSSQNPLLARLAKDKTRFTVLAKADLADEAITSRWCLTLEAIAVALKDNRERQRLLEYFRHGLARQVAKRYARPWRLMVAGIPNVGKSTLINLLAGRRSAKVGDRPGVTRSQQWINAAADIQLLDTPGLLWPKLDDEQTAFRLAASGCIRDDVLPVEDVARWLLDFLRSHYPQSLEEKYGNSGVGLEDVGRKRGALSKGNAVDTEKAAEILLLDFRSGKLGRISLDREGVDQT